MEAVLFIAFMSAALGLGLWVPVLLPLAVGGVSLFLGLLVVRGVLGRYRGGKSYPVAVCSLAAVFLALALVFAFTFPQELSGENFFRDILPLPVSFK